MKHFGILVALLLAATAGQAQLIINELSQGAGNQEYVELLVTGTPTCGGSNTVDIRGWIIDDNNSWHAAGSGSGIAGGHARFDSIPQWASVKIGTLIVIYNNTDKGPAISALADDVNDSNGDCVYIIPINSSVIQKNTTLPANNGTMTTYATSSANYSSTGTWTPLGMRNAGDAFHTVSPANKTRAYHAIGWGNNNDSINVYFAGDQGGKVIYMANTVDNNPFSQANYVDTTSTTSETPGAPNNPANAAWILSMNNNCQPFLTPGPVSFNSPGSITCSTTSVVLTANSTNGVVYTWSNGATGQNDTVSAAGTYDVTVTNAAGSCSVTGSIVVTSNSSLAITASSTNTGCGAGSGTASVTVTNGTATGYLWSNNQTTASISGLAAGTYGVTVTAGGGCSATASVDVLNTGSIAIATTSTNTTCGAQNGTATVSVLNGGTASAYNWSNNGTTATINNLAPGTYRVTVTGNGGCTAVDSVTVTASNNSTVSISSDVTTICARDSAIICAPAGSASYLWNTGATTSCITVKAAGGYYVTVTENGGCTALSNRVDISVYPSPPVSISVKGDTLSAYNALSYQWYLNNSPIQGATNSTYIASQPGSYQVQVTDTNSCSSFSNAVVITGLNDISAEDMVVYPNPLAGGNWMLNTTPGLIGNTVRIYNNEGRLVYESEIRSEQMELEAELARGVYFLKINSGQSNFTRKLIKL